MISREMNEQISAHRLNEYNSQFVSNNTPWNDKHMTGTTLIAVEYNEGVVLGADSRSSTGVYVANRVANKLWKLTDRVYCCRSGSAADTQAVSDVVAYHLRFHKMELGEEPRVEVAAAMFQEVCYTHRDSLTAGIIVAGWDKHKGGQLYSIPIGGMMVRQPICTGGSGSTYVYGYVDANFKRNMTKEEAMKFVSNTVALAMMRDGSSGGVINLGVINKDGVERHLVMGDDIPKFH